MPEPRLPLFAPPAEVPLPAAPGCHPGRHVFFPNQIAAINAALATGRPLLVRGEPGVGKSQLARAAAEAMERAFVLHAVDAQTETRDLLWTFDAVQRLADAQAARHVHDAKADLALHHYIQPGALWWALNPETAYRQANKAGYGACALSGAERLSAGTVVLIDEIDKADPCVPNGLLDALGRGSFRVHGMEEVQAKHGHRPLILFTTNEERSLPDAFLRRCLVLYLTLPVTEAEFRRRHPSAPVPPLVPGRPAAALEQHLCHLGRVHFPGIEENVLEEAAKMLVRDRADCLQRRQSPPGVAEYIDLLRAVQELRGEGAAPLELLAQLQDFSFRKHPTEPSR